ncbi:hypothetical protein GCM10027047_25660 [Rhodococcus aerolatus]
MSGHTYPVEVVGLLVSPVHRYGGRPRDGAAPLPPGAAAERRTRVEVVAGVGVPGDRYAGRAAHLGASVSLVAVEALEAVAAELGAAPFDWAATRRTVAVRGVDLNALRGVDFTLTCGAHPPVTLGGRRPASPCAWLDAVLVPGAHHGLRGRGGLRCQVLASGVLALGPAVLTSPVPLDPARAGLPAVRAARLP